MMGDFGEQAKASIVQQHQTDEAQSHLGKLHQVIGEIQNRQQVMQDDLDALLVLAEASIGTDTVLPEGILLELEVDEAYVRRQPIALLDDVGSDADDDWDSYFTKVEAYASRNELTFSGDPFANLLSPTQRIAFEKRIKDEFSLKNANCDKYDYMIAGTCGFIGGLIDILFVGLPGEGPLTKFTDEVANKAVQKFSKFCGWNGPNEGANPVKSAIGYLEGTFKVNYDQTTGQGKNGVGGAFNMAMKNHHLKSMGHWPDLIGLFFSILDQFTSTAHFVDGGQIISISNDNEFQLSGSTFVAKVFSGFVNWLGHLMSDMAGSSGSAGRGSGIPVPFFGSLQFIDFGQFRVKINDKKEVLNSFAEVSVRVFQEGYDFRHGMALAIPVLTTELLVRIMWTFKAKFYHDRPWRDCVPSANNAELRRMLLIGHGTLCVVDGVDAAVRSGGEIVQFMLRTNFIGWMRFGTIALKELKAWYRVGGLDIEAVDAYLDAEYQRLLA